MIGFGGQEKFGRANIQQLIRESKNYPFLSAKEERVILRKVAAGDEEARIKLIMSNMRFILKIASKEHYGDNGDDSFNDVASRAIHGALLASHRFNPKKHKTKFRTYAVIWIRQQIREYKHYEVRTIRVPINKVNEVGRMIKDRGADATMEHLGETNPNLMHMYHGATSLNIPATHGVESKYSDDVIDLIPDTSETMFSETLEGTSAREFLDEVLDNALDDREKHVVKLYHGYYTDDDEEMTLEDIGQLMGLTRERIRQIKEEALEKVRRYIRKRGVYAIDQVA